VEPLQAGALADVLPSVASHLAPGVAADSLGLPEADRYAVLLVDGLGWFNLWDDPSVAPALAALRAARLTTGLPSTTTASLATLATGADTARHGLVGYSFRTRPGVVMQTMTWDDATFIPEVAQPVPTWFERLDGCAVVVPAAFAGSGLTRAVLRGAAFVPVPDERDWPSRVAQAVETVAAHRLTYVYERGLDHIGHRHGWRTSAWRHHLGLVDAYAASLLQSLPSGTALLVTGDHGMVDVPKTHRVFIEDEPSLAADVDLIGGEARLRHIYTADPVAVASRWAEWWGPRADVRLRQDAMDWFGSVPPSAQVAQRLGDVVLAMKDDWAACTATRPREASMTGLHGSATEQERTVPLLTALV